MKKSANKMQLTIGWLYPDLMSTYGDRGNIICLVKRLEWRGITGEVEKIELDTPLSVLLSCNLIIGGGAQDRQQGIVFEDLKKKKGPVLRKLFEGGTPGLFVCGSPQLLGHYYTMGDGTKLEGLGILDFVSKHFGHDKPRCIGNTAGRLNYKFILNEKQDTIVGFENHGGRTYSGKNVEPLARVLAGFGNNGEDLTEGALYKNVIACYYHGPFLPKNPHIADWLITKALEVKYKKEVKLPVLDDTLEWQAHNFMLEKMGVLNGQKKIRK